MATELMQLRRRTVLELELVPNHHHLHEESLSSSSSGTAVNSKSKRKSFAGRDIPQQHCSVEVVLNLPQADLPLWNLPVAPPTKAESSETSTEESKGEDDDTEEPKQEEEPELAVRVRQSELMSVLAQEVLPQAFGETELDQMLWMTQSGKRPRRQRRKQKQDRKWDGKSRKEEDAKEGKPKDPDEAAEEAAAVVIGEVNVATKKSYLAPDFMEEAPGGADVRYAFGETIQLQYRVEDLQSSSSQRHASATLLFPPLAPLQGQDKKKQSKKKEPKGVEEEEVLFRNVNKLSKRIIVWCYPLDSSNPTEPVGMGGVATKGSNTNEKDRGEGFYRPDFIPLAQLFRSA